MDAAFRNEFAALAEDPEGFHSLMQSVYGENYNRGEAESLRQRALANDFGWLPSVQYVDAATLNGGQAAYDTASATIFINRELQGTALGGQYFIEEVGHHLDVQLNTIDTAGDEGEVFQRLLAGEELSAGELQNLRTENDNGSIVVNGEKLAVEFGGWSWFEDNVTAPIRENVIEPVVQTVENTGEIIEDNITKPLVDYVIKPTENHLESYFNAYANYVDNTVEAAGDILQGHVASGVQGLIEAPVDLAQDQAGATVDAAVTVGNSILEGIDNLFGLGNERGLTAAEIAYLRPIYGDSIDYGSIRVQQGGSFESLFNTDLLGNSNNATTIGNEIHMPNQVGGDNDAVFNADGSLTEEGMQLLGHEVAHVWQYQSEGSGYLSDSAGEQINEGDDAYDWESAVAAGTSFENMGVEQQAELAEQIGVALQAEVDAGRGAILQQRYFQIDGRTVTPAEWAVIQATHASLQAG